MKVAASLAIYVSFLVSSVSAGSATKLYSFKCGTDVFYCPGLSSDKVCNSGGSTINNGNYIALSAEECTNMIAIANGPSPIGQKCPNNKGISDYISYDCSGARGWKTDSSGSSYCTSCTGSCGLTTCSGGSGSGDPHFITHDGTSYDFHGECDLVMARSRSLLSGFELDVHARTKDMGGWSLISNAAVRIGDDVLEVQNDGKHYLNGVPDVEFPLFMAGHHKVIKEIEDLDNDSKDPEEQYRTWYIIDIHENSHRIEIMRFKDMISVQIDAELHDTVGMLGTPSKVGLAGRDQQTVFEDPEKMGMEWQVRDTEPMLFHEIRVPQFPQSCVIPDAAARRLRYTERSLREASDVCANVDGAKLRNCIEDVLLTGNRYVAHAYIGL